MAKFILSIVVCIVGVAATVECGSFGFLGAQVGPCGKNTVGKYVQEHCIENLPCYECKCTLVATILSPLYLIDHTDCRLANGCSGPSCGQGQGQGQAQGSGQVTGQGALQGSVEASGQLGARV